jgi:hypothetical protein
MLAVLSKTKVEYIEILNKESGIVEKWQKYSKKGR